MSAKTILISVWIWYAAVMLSSFMTGTFIGGTQRNTLDRLQVFSVHHIGPLPVPLINAGFFDGILEIITVSQFGFLQGSPLIIVIYLFNIAILVGGLIIFSGILANFFGLIRGR